MMGAMLVRHEPTSASAVRRELSLDLSLHGVPEDVIHDVALVASELIGNAVRHAGVRDQDELDVNWAVHREAVVISVEDPSDEMPVRRRVDVDAASGRGLAIIDAIATDWGVERTRRGKRVWARVGLPPTH